MVEAVPPVSVFVTTYNHADYVEEALESLRHQSFPDFEVIITDDASTDRTADIIEAWLARTGYPARFIRNATNRGICANRNAALARSSGSFVCSLSGDDCYETDRIERQLRCFLAQPEEVAAVYSDMLVVDAGGRPYGRSFLETMLDGAAPPQGRLFSRLLAGNFLPAPAVMVRRSAIAAVGGYDESLFFEDLDMWLRLSFLFRFVHLPGRLVRYRMHESSMSNRRPNRPLLHKSYTQILEKWLAAELDDRNHRLVLDELLRNGAMQLVVRDVVAARHTLDTALLAEVRPERRLLARAGRWPGAYLGARALLPLYRIYRRLKGLPRVRWDKRGP